MHCPKCGGEIPFYDLRPNCKHCGVNIMYYTQEAGLTLDAKRTELESAVARMVIARIKANFIGGKLQIARMIVLFVVAATTLIPFGGAKYELPFFHETLSAGLIGLIGAFQNGLLLNIPQLLTSALVSRATVAAVVPIAMLLLLAVLDVALFVIYMLGFLNLTGTTKHQRNGSLVGAILACLTQIAVLVLYFTTPESAYSAPVLGFGALVMAAAFLALFFLNRALLKKGIEPTYRENDLKRKELLKKVRAGEVDLDSLPLPIFESDDEREERLKALEEALKAEEEGKEL